MAAYGFEEPPTAYTRDAKESGAGEYAMAAQLVADGKPDYRVLDVDAALGVRLHVFDQQQQQQGPAVAAERACALLFHGGGWSGGDPSLFHPAARYLAGRGLVAICVQYRLMAGEVTAFDCVADCRAALAFVRANAAQLGVDPHRISAMGDSAGGHLALMLGYPAPTGGGTPADAIISYNPVADLETCQHGIDHVHGPDRLIISPCHLIRDVALDAPPAPTLLMHGEDDTVCLVDQSRLYASIAEERWQQVGADGAAQPLPAGFCRFVELPGTQHAFCLPNYSAAPSIVAAAMHEAVLFLGRVGHISLTAAEMAEAAGVDGGAALAAAKL